jgi:hypothetical protein
MVYFYNDAGVPIPAVEAGAACLNDCADYQIFGACPEGGEQ